MTVGGSTVERFQTPVDEAAIEAACARAFGPQARVSSVVELEGGMYNSTYRLSISGRERPVVLRVAPEPRQQFRSEWQLMRNEYATLPWLSPIASLMPHVLAADWSHEVIGRDWMIQSFLDGAPAFGPRGLRAYPRQQWTGFYRQLGSIAKTIHAIAGPHFGSVSGPGCSTWSQAVSISLQDIASDLETAGLDATVLRRAGNAAADRSEVLDQITEPRLLAGDLWTVNVLLAEDATEPTVTGVLDLDRTLWGDPAADWSIRMALSKPGTERDAFWDRDGYGPPDGSPDAMWRRYVYEARHLGATLLETYRLGDEDGLQATHDDLTTIVGELA